MKVAVVTATVGETDTLREPSIVAPGVRYYCGSDHPIKSEVWQRIDLSSDDPVMTARQFKALWMPPEVDVWLWIDAHYRLEIDPRILVPYVLRYDLAVLCHPWCKSIDEEAGAIVERGIVPEGRLRDQIECYRAAGFRDSSHSSTGFMMRRADERIAAFNRLWWKETQRHGHSRDQMSFDYCVWRSGVQIVYLEGGYLDNPYATWQY